MSRSRPVLTPDRVVDAAAEIADRDGLAAVTLAEVAAALEVRTPSLYNHVAGLDALHRGLALRGLQELGRALQRVAVGRAGDQAVRAIARAYRDFARRRPGLYAATVRAAEPDDEELASAARDVLDTVLAVLAAYQLDEHEVIHAARALRSALHGFTALELAGGFGLPEDVDHSFAWFLDRLPALLRAGEEAA